MEEADWYDDKDDYIEEIVEECIDGDEDACEEVTDILEEVYEDPNGGAKGDGEGKADEPVWASRVEIDGSPYFVAAVGYDGLAARDAALDALAGVQRIFKGSAQAA